VNIIDSGIGLACTAFLVPIMGINGYILSLYICEFINCAASLGRLVYLLGRLPRLLSGLMISAPTALLSSQLLSLCGLGAIPTAPGVIITALTYFSAVALILNIMKRRSRECIVTA